VNKNKQHFKTNAFMLVSKLLGQHQT